MKDIKKRQRQFLAGLLAFILGMLPAVSVWAETIYTITGGNDAFKVEKGTTVVVSRTAGGTDSSAFFYCEPGDEISIARASWDGNITDYNANTLFMNANGDSECTPSDKKTKWVTTTKDNQDQDINIDPIKLEVPGGNNAAYGKGVLNWRVKVVYDSGGQAKSFVFYNQTPIKYYKWTEGNGFIQNEQLDYVPLTNTITEWDNGYWYAVNSDVVIENRIIVNGEVNLILCDGKTLTAKGGITVPKGTILNIYVQSYGDNMGTLYAGTTNGTDKTIGDKNAGIGGNEDTANDDGKDSYHAGTIYIHGGNISAKGGHSAAGIGGGFYDNDTQDYGGNGGKVYIYGGNINAEGGYGAAGIGGGYCNGYSGDGAEVDVRGGTVTTIGGATEGDVAYGIGAGYGDSGQNPQQKALKIGTGLALYAGPSANPPKVDSSISLNPYPDTEPRYQYMDIKPYTEPSSSSGGGSYTPDCF